MVCFQVVNVLSVLGYNIYKFNTYNIYYSLLSD